MTEFTDRQELNERLSLIENMIAEGRQITERWGWTFVLWGVALYTAIAWSSRGYAAIAWPVTMIAAGVLTGVVASRKASRVLKTTLGRSMSSIWVSLGVTLFLFGMCSGISHRVEPHLYLAAVEVMLGMANATSSMILRWKLQFACAIVWWAASVVSLFGTITQGFLAFLAATFLCQIVFGLYMMISDAHGNRAGRGRTVNTGAQHA